MTYRLLDRHQAAQIRYRFKRRGKLTAQEVVEQLAAWHEVSVRTIQRIVYDPNRGKGWGMHHYYYGNPKELDLSKIREEAQQRLNGTGSFRGAHEESVIHHHTRYNVSEGKSHSPHATCVGTQHEYYTIDNGVFIEVAQADVTA